MASGSSVLLVEDEVLIRMMIADMLDELGHKVVAEAGSIDEALRLAANVDADFAVLDVSLAGERVTPVADLLIARNLPFFFASGYGSNGLPDGYQHHAALQKPFQMQSLAEMIENMLA
ncbi:response regulator [Bradyrhizobium sp. WYCCWR 13023]|uniref:Response regulator n=1 Tax=Bradyrhizobium zhengyangense TaxID=2911009 RepID=A0A9X1UD55_9BRAD|nr:response regulator [Bradyrhizobium zhengyangense]MCG2633196.1 response regulator [Bradyrhizobium zhengyangense]MCG2673452.1 response regulator [Bradyrhizobium zhengyangense]